MDVSVHFKPGHRWLRSAKTPSVLGGGLLERVRSTTLALLGVTTAVGLAMVALALNQSWPLVADSPIPGAPFRQEAIGKATVAAQARVSAFDSGASNAARAARSDTPRVAGGGDTRGPQAPKVDSEPSGSAELVVAPSAPAEPRGDAPSDTDKPTPAPSPVGTTPQAPAAPIPEPAQPEPAPPQPPAGVEKTPPATSAEAPVDSSDDDDWDDDDDHDWDDDDDWDDDHGHGRHRSHGHHDD